MKYAIIIPDGACDEPLTELEGRTPLEAARTRAMDEIASNGRQGMVQTIPPGFEAGSDVAINRGDSDQTVNALPSGALKELVTGANVSGPSQTIPARQARIFTK